MYILLDKIIYDLSSYMKRIMFAQALKMCNQKLLRINHNATKFTFSLVNIFQNYNRCRLMR